MCPKRPFADTGRRITAARIRRSEADVRRSRTTGPRTLFLQPLRVHFVRIGPRLPFGHEFIEELGIPGGEIAAFGAVGRNVEQLPFLRFLVLDSFPVAVAHVAVVEMLPEKIVVEHGLRLTDRRHEALALQRMNVVAAVGRRIGRPRDIDERSHQVGQEAHVVADLSVETGEASGP